VKLFYMVVLILTISPFLYAKDSNYSSVYTSLKLKDCQAVDSSDRSYSQECPGKENYRVFHESGDTRSWLVIKKGDDVVIDLFQPVMQNAPGKFARVSGKVAEWRYQGKTPIALIFRIAGNGEIFLSGKSQQPSYETKTTLLVVRLEGEKACVIGTTTSNLKAKKIADGQQMCHSGRVSLPSKQDTKAKDGLYSLTVKTEPANSIIKVMNIIPKYQAGIRLKPGKYDILVKRKGYKTWRKWVKIVDFDLVIDLPLERSDSKVPPSKVNNGLYSLTVKAKPANSTIKIMNIRPKYQAGIRLKPGKYDILVKRKGYKTWRKWVKIIDIDLEIDLKLRSYGNK